MLQFICISLCPNAYLYMYAFSQPRTWIQGGVKCYISIAIGSVHLYARDVLTPKLHCVWYFLHLYVIFSRGYIFYFLRSCSQLFGLYVIVVVLLRWISYPMYNRHKLINVSSLCSVIILSIGFMQRVILPNAHTLAPTWNGMFCGESLFSLAQIDFYW